MGDARQGSLEAQQQAVVARRGSEPLRRRSSLPLVIERRKVFNSQTRAFARPWSRTNDVVAH